MNINNFAKVHTHLFFLTTAPMEDILAEGYSEYEVDTAYMIEHEHAFSGNKCDPYNSCLGYNTLSSYQYDAESEMDDAYWDNFNI